MWAVGWVAIIGILWEMLEWYIESWRPYGTKKKWINNTISDLVVEIGLAIWMVV